jgi:glycosyltransferase involved in cell wall biosynthesis
MLSVVVPSYNRNEDLRLCLESIRSHSRLENEIIVSSPSEDESTRRMCEEFRAKFVLDGSRDGAKRVKSLYAVLNEGIEQATQDHVCWLNDDCIVLQDWDRIAMSYFGADTGLVVLKTRGIGNHPDFLIGRTVLNAICANYAILKKSIGIRFDEEFSWYHGDADIGIQVLSKTPYTVVGTEEGLVVHAHRVDETRKQNESDPRIGPDGDRLIAKWRHYKLKGAHVVRMSPVEYCIHRLLHYSGRLRSKVQSISR